MYLSLYIEKLEFQSNTTGFILVTFFFLISVFVNPFLRVRTLAAVILNIFAYFISLYVTVSCLCWGPPPSMFECYTTNYKICFINKNKILSLKLLTQWVLNIIKLRYYFCRSVQCPLTNAYIYLYAFFPCSVGRMKEPKDLALLG